MDSKTAPNIGAVLYICAGRFAIFPVSLYIRYP